MATATALKTAHHAPAQPETLKVSIQQLDKLANVISDIDGIKNSDTNQLPLLISRGKQAVDAIRDTEFNPNDWASSKLFPALEIQAQQLDEFTSLLKTMQDIIAGGQVALLQPIIETAHDLITAMAGEYADQIYAPED